MISLRFGHLRAANGSRDGPWSVLAAALLTLISFAVLFVAMRHRGAWPVPVSPSAEVPAPERVVMVPLRVPSTVNRPRATLVLPGARTVIRQTASAAVSPNEAALDSGIVDRAAPAPRAAGGPRTNTRSSLTPSARLAPPSAPARPMYAPRSQFNPFQPPPPPTAAERDSIVADMAASMAELAARRKPTEAERDAAAKEAILKIRNSGRALLVPPDNTGGLIASRLPLPIFSATGSRAARLRVRQSFEENRGRLERLRERADSLRRMRADTLFRAPRAAAPEQ